MSNLPLNKADQALDEAGNQIVKAVRQLHYTQSITHTEQVLLNQKITVIYNKLRELHQKIAEKTS